MSYSLCKSNHHNSALVATRPITPGTLILSESPLFTTRLLLLNRQPPSSLLSSAINKELTALPLLQKTRVRSLITNPRTFVDEFRRLVVPLSPEGCSDLGSASKKEDGVGDRSREVGIFEEMRLVKHACLPNSQQSWNERLGKETLYAVREIAEGEEITVSYLGMGDPISKLRATYGREYACGNCSSTLTTQLIEMMDKRGQVGDPVERLFWNSRIWRSWVKEGRRGVVMGRLLEDCFESVARYGDVERARHFIGMAEREYMMCEGEEGGDVLRVREFVEDVRRWRGWEAMGRELAVVEDEDEDEDENMDMDMDMDMQITSIRKRQPSEISIESDDEDDEGSQEESEEEVEATDGDGNDNAAEEIVRREKKIPIEGTPAFDDWLWLREPKYYAGTGFERPESPAMTRRLLWRQQGLI